MDVGAITTGVGAVTTALLNSTSLQDMNVLSGVFPHYPAGPAGARSLRIGFPEMALAALPTSKTTSLRLARGAAAGFIASPIVLGQPLFPATVQGRTLVWDTLASHYAVDTTLTGAPATGIRILLYTSDPFTGQPVRPLAQTGYLELSDKSTALTATLGTLLAFGTTTVAQYDVVFATGIVHGDSSVWVTSTGFINDGAGKPVGFVFGDTSGTGTLGVGGVVTGSDGTSVQSLLTITNFTLGITVTAQKGGNVIALDALEQGEFTTSISGTVKFNGTSVATIGGTIGSPTFTGSGGRVLSNTEATGLAEILTGGVLIASELSDLVLAPALVVFGG